MAIASVKTSRPSPAGYFMAEDEGAGLLPWSHVAERMREAWNYWLATCSESGRAHAMPVWGVWLDDEFLFSTGTTTRKGRNLAANPFASLHLESGNQLVVVEGACRESSEARDIERYIAAYNPKYSWDFRPEQLQRGLFVFRPEKAFAWLDGQGEGFSGTATRFIIEED